MEANVVNLSEDERTDSAARCVLVTGAAGFIGACVAQRLLDQGWRVVGIDNLNDYYDVRLKEHRLSSLLQGRSKSAFKFYHLDIEDAGAVGNVFSAHRFDAVINLAARAGVRYSIENPHVYLSTNTSGTLNLLEAMRCHGVKKLVLASTSSLYAGASMPFGECADASRPLSPYAASKLAAEALAYTYHHLHGIDVSVVRYFTVYGPAGRPDMSPFRFMRWIDEGAPIRLYGDGSQSRDFTYIDDIVEGTIRALKPLGYEIINLGGGNSPLTINRVIQLFAGYLGKTAIIDRQPFHAADMRDTQADVAKAERLLNWRPKIRPEDGFRRTIEWYRDNREFVLSLSM